MNTHCALLLAALLGAGSLTAGTDAQDVAAPATARAAAASSSEPQAQIRLVDEFSAFAGSDANSRSLVAGLRQATEITLTARGAGGQPGKATQLVPPTRPMDYGNVRVALVLAREQLAQLGITQPTPGEIKAVLAGGGVASRTNGRAASPFLHPGLLQMRAGGMSWAKIAGTMGITLAQAKEGRVRQAGAATPPISNYPAAAKGGGGIVPPAVAGSGVPPLGRASAAPAPISSASITKSSAGGPRTAPDAKPAVAARRPATAVPGPEIRRPRASVVAAANAAPRVEKVATPAQEGAKGGAVRMTAAVPAASDEPAGTEEGYSAE
ncbi:MAG TPA: hypothetical protein VLB72_08000 [Burkholderiales bacterium]|nr:hypothetical protein [Burkholderiales bacterium]